MEKFLVDTSIFIDHLRGYEPALDFLKKNKQIILSYVTAGELLQGVKNKNELKKVSKLLKTHEIDLGSKEINLLALKLVNKHFLKHGIEFLDALIAAAALVNEYELITKNIKHFNFIKGLKVRKPY